MNDKISEPRVFQVYQVDVPGGGWSRFVVAPTVSRALALSITDEDQVAAGQPLIAWNVTGGFLQSNHIAARHTWDLLREQREGLVEYDRETGWVRLSRLC